MKYLIIICIILMLPGVAFAELFPADLEQFNLDLSSIISFFAGCLAIIAFIFGVNGGNHL